MICTMLALIIYVMSVHVHFAPLRLRMLRLKVGLIDSLGELVALLEAGRGPIGRAGRAAPTGTSRTGSVADMAAYSPSACPKAVRATRGLGRVAAPS
jgi:hypothetical protein